MRARKPFTGAKTANMDSIEFLLIVAVFAAVLYWYLKNAEAGVEGLLGYLALLDDPEEAKAGKSRAYRIKERAARGNTTMRDARAEKNRHAAYRLKGGDDASRTERLRKRFHRQDEARYRVKDKAAHYKQRKSPETDD